VLFSNGFKIDKLLDLAQKIIKTKGSTRPNSIELGLYLEFDYSAMPKMLPGIEQDRNEGMKFDFEIGSIGKDNSCIIKSPCYFLSFSNEKIIFYH
jgi:hypothetical protein